MNKDQQLIWEAYLHEAPIEPGTAWDEPVNIDKGAKERLGKYSKQTLDDESLEAIVQSIKDFLEGHENSHFPGDEDDFKAKIRDLILDAVKDIEGLKINSTNAMYAARVIRNELTKLGVIKVVDDEVEIHNTPPADVEASVEKGVEDAVKGEPAPAAAPEEQPFERSQVIFRQKYTLDDEVPVDGEDLEKAKDVIFRKLGQEFTGRDLIIQLRDEFTYDKAKDLGGELLAAGALVEVEDEEDEDKVVDVGGDEGSEDEDYNKAVSSAYSDLKRDIASGASPTMRPDDW